MTTTVSSTGRGGSHHRSERCGTAHKTAVIAGVAGLLLYVGGLVGPIDTAIGAALAIATVAGS